MNLVLLNSDFVNNKLVASYGVRKTATFTIIDEEFAGTNDLGTVKKVTVYIETKDAAGEVTNTYLSGMVIGIGDGIVGVTTSNTEIRGKELTHENMEQCTVILYE